MKKRKGQEEVSWWYCRNRKMDNRNIVYHNTLCTFHGLIRFYINPFGFTYKRILI